MDGQGCEVGRVIVEPGYYDVPHPECLARLLQVIEEGLVALARMTREAWVQLIVQCLDVEHHQVALLQRLLHLFVEIDTARVQTGMQALSLAKPKECFHKLCLHQRFTARAGHTARADEGSVF